MAQIAADPGAWGAPAGSVEVLSSRRQNVKHFRHADGRTHTAVFGGVLHYEPTPGAGGWDDTDALFRPSGSAQVADHLPFGVTINGTNLDIVNRANNVGIRYTIPAVGVTVTRNQIQFSFGGIAWTYTVTRSGLKLEGLVPSARGNTSFNFSYARLGGAGLVLQADGSVAGVGFTLPPPHITGANGIDYPGLTSWSLSAPSLTLNLDDTSLPPAAYPYVLDPTTTFAVAASGDDGRVVRQDDVYPPGAGTSFAEFILTADANFLVDRYFDSVSVPNIYKVGVGLARWDTSAIPDTATITGASFVAGQTNTLQNADTRSLLLEWYASANWPIDTGDYTATAPGSPIGSLALGSATANVDNTIVLSDLTGISKTGYTGMRMHISGSTPTGFNRFGMFAFDDAGTGNEPRLLVTYTLPLLPLGDRRYLTAVRRAATW